MTAHPLPHPDKQRMECRGEAAAGQESEERPLLDRNACGGGEEATPGEECRGVVASGQECREEATSGQECGEEAISGQECRGEAASGQECRGEVTSGWVCRGEKGRLLEE